MKGMTIWFALMLVSIVVASMWQSIPALKQAVHTVLDPSLGALLDWNPTYGMILITAMVTLITTLLQKYLTDQDMLKQIKEEQKLVQQEMKLAKENPDKSMELSKKSMELTMKAMPITMRPVMITIIPFVLLLRWFGDYFSQHVVKILYVFSWFWAYLVFSIVFSIIFRKMLKVH